MEDFRKSLVHGFTHFGYRNSVNANELRTLEYEETKFSKNIKLLNASGQFLIAYRGDRSLLCYDLDMILLNMITLREKFQQLEIRKDRWYFVVKNRVIILALPDFFYVHTIKVPKRILKIYIDKNELSVLVKGHVYFFGRHKFQRIEDQEVVSTAEAMINIKGGVLLLQGKKELRMLRSENFDNNLFTPRFLEQFRRRQPPAIHIKDHEYIAITENKMTYYFTDTGYEGTLFPPIDWEKQPKKIIYLKPYTLIAVLNKTKIELRNIFTGNLISTETFKHNLLAQSSKNLYYYEQKLGSVKKFVPDPPDEKIIQCIDDGYYEIAIEMSVWCKIPHLEKRARLELGLECFFGEEKKFAEAAAQMHISGYHWITWALFRRIIEMPEYTRRKTEPHINAEIELISKYSIPKEYTAILRENIEVFSDKAILKQARDLFIPVFLELRLLEIPELTQFSEIFIFHTFIRIQKRVSDLVTILKDPSNTLPLDFCEKSLLKRGHFDLYIELCITKQVYKRALDLVLDRYEKEQDQQWLQKMTQILKSMVSQPELFIEYIAELSGRDQNLAESLFFEDQAEIISKMDIFGTLVPIMIDNIGIEKTIIYWDLIQSTDVEYHNNLAMLQIKGVLSDNLDAKIFQEYLKQNDYYDIANVEMMLPPGRMNTERCIIWDKLGKWNLVIDHYIRNDPDEAEKYIIEKSNESITNYYLALMTTNPLDESKTDRLVRFLNSAPPQIFNFWDSLHSIPDSVDVGSFEQHFRGGFKYLDQMRRKSHVKQNLLATEIIKLRERYSRRSQICVEITEDTIWDKWGGLIGESAFAVSQMKRVFHYDCLDENVTTIAS